MPVIASIVQQHVEDAVHLRLVRSRLLRAPHVSLRQLARHDERLAAHLDGIAVGGAYADEIVRSLLESPGCGEVFTVAVRALDSGRHDALSPLYELCEVASEDACAGLLSAIGWVSAGSLQGVGRALLESKRPLLRAWGLAACAMHEVDPGPALVRAIEDDDVRLRLRALLVAVRRGSQDLLGACDAAARGSAPEFACRAAQACVLLGERGAGLERLARAALDPAVPRGVAADALRTLLRAQPVAQACALLAQLAKAPAPLIEAIRAVGVAGDPVYVPWLLERMLDLPTARAAAESFATITGIDLMRFDLEDPPVPLPDADEAPSEADDDADLPWPDVPKIARWWRDNGHHFPAGARFFAGQQPSVLHCTGVLRDGTQRQRAAAAEHLLLLLPGSPLFDIAAPAWRQRRRLGIRSTGA